MRLFATLCFFCLCMNAVMANSLSHTTPSFIINDANQRFDQINLKLSTQNLNSTSLEAAISTLKALTAEADKCVDAAQKRLTKINSLIEQSTNAAEKNTTGVDLRYLDSEKKDKADRLAQCRLFSIRAGEAIDAYTAATAKLNEKETLIQQLPLWNIIRQLIEYPPHDTLIALSQIHLPPLLQSQFLWIILGCASLLVSFFVLFGAKKNPTTRHYFQIKTLRIPHLLLLTTCVMTGSIFILLQELNGTTVLVNVSRTLFFYLSACVLTTLIFKIKYVRILLTWYRFDSLFFQLALLTFFNFYTFAILGNILRKALDLNNLIWQLSQAIYLLVMFITVIYFIYYFCHAHSHQPLIKRYKKLIQRTGLLIYIALMVVTILGYHALAIRLNSSGLTTFIIIFITVLIVHGINTLYFVVTHHPEIKTTVMKYFGYKHEQVFTEFLILKITAQVSIFAISLFLILFDWAFALYYVHRAYEQLIHGVHLGKVTLYPTHIVLGVVVYCLLYLLFRSMSTAISRHQQFDNEEETQVAIASILTYVGFSLALVCALLVAGFNFTGLAIVAGALSVGIGLGLQSIVNNFVSGLILLIEKPIRAGDRINIDGVEGFVKKIRVRSTHIITPAHEDVIVPNSDLITHRVTNYVYTNKQLFIACDINVPLGSDTQRVREILLKAAHDHEDVIKTGRSKPQVLFRSFGEKALLFQLCCLIKDVNKKLLVQSELNFTVDQLLRENNI